MSWALHVIPSVDGGAYQPNAMEREVACASCGRNVVGATQGWALGERDGMRRAKQPIALPVFIDTICVGAFGH